MVDWKFACKSIRLRTTTEIGGLLVFVEHLEFSSALGALALQT